MGALRKKYDATFKREAVQLLGCNNYITKPIDYDKFVAAIRQFGLFLLVVELPKI